MLNKLKEKVNLTELAHRITLHTCQETRIGLSEPVDFILAFYVLHEIPDQDRLFHEIARCLKSTGQMLIVEPPFHVSKSAFEAMILKARNAGLTLVKRPKVLLSKTALLQRQ
jgi:ubiquinone/menaquinone biosynthesis C-methylase UbiE